MYDCYITFRSITGAQLGSALLNRSGIYHQMIRTPKQLSEKGCGYTIRVPRHTLNQTVDVLHRGGAPYQRFFWSREDGVMEELIL